MITVTFLQCVAFFAKHFPQRFNLLANFDPTPACFFFLVKLYDSLRGKYLFARLV